MSVRLRWFSDPACASSWAAEPLKRRLQLDFGGELDVRHVMGGLAREVGDPPYVSWLRAAQDGMPVDPLLWVEGPIKSTYPACMAVKAAGEQGPQAADHYLRRLREGLFCHRRKLDSTEALIEEARRAGLDAGRFRVDLGSHATVEAFGTDLELRRAHGSGLPFAVYGDDRHVAGDAPIEEHRAAAIAAGGTAGGENLTVEEAFARFGSLALPEVEVLCGLPTPRAAADVWRLVSEWKVKAVPVLAGHLFEPA